MAGCGCGAERRTLPHILHDCPRLASYRPKFYNYLNRKFPDINPREVSIVDLIFNPNSELVRELGGFVCRDKQIV